jgi:hypothetical protein
MKRFVKASTLCIIMALIAALLCAPIQAAETASTQHIVGNGAIGEGVGKQTTLIDFANSDLDGFGPFSGSETLNFGSSAVWGTNVLKTHLSSPESEMGITKTFSNSSVFNNASSLSVQLVAQTGSYAITLRLAGTDKNGTAVAWEAVVHVGTKEWQTVTFDIAAFASLIDANAPVTLTLLGAANNEENAGDSWMMKSIYISTPETFPEYVLPIAAAVCGLVIGFAAFFIIHRSIINKNRRPRWEEEF